jgi:thioredoxin:protein disulfide reductase
MKFLAALFVSALLLIAVAALPFPPQIPSGREVVSPTAFVSLEPVARDASFQIAVVLKIRDGFHINAHQPSADYLIATNLTANPQTGFKLGQPSYPKGELHTFAFSKTPLNVYQGKVIVRLPITVLPNAPLGPQHIPLKLRYQACNQELCLPPATLDVDAAFTVDANPANSHPTHAELFPAR